MHRRYPSQEKLSVWTALAHIWLGRISVTLGMINGGLGLLLRANMTTRAEWIVYGVLAGVIWMSWIFIVVSVPLKRREKIPGTISRFEAARRESDESKATIVRHVPDMQAAEKYL
jgi:hypothetical protein